MRHTHWTYKRTVPVLSTERTVEDTLRRLSREAEGMLPGATVTVAYLGISPTGRIRAAVTIDRAASDE